MIVGICGLTKSGKSAAGNVLVGAHNYAAIAFGDAIKRVLMEVYDFTVEQLWGSEKEVPDKRFPREHSFEWDSDGRRKCSCCGMAGAKELDGSKCYLTPRHAMKTLGTEWGRNCYWDTWARRAVKDALTVLDDHLEYNREVGVVPAITRDYDGVVIPDVRFKNEMQVIREAGGKLVRIVRPGYEKPQWDHLSETEQLTVPDSEFNYIMHNQGTLEDLALKVEDMTMLLEDLEEPM